MSNKTYNLQDLAWLAGIMDGEGCIHIRKNKVTATSKHKTTNYSLIIKIGITHKPTIDRIQKIFNFGHINISSINRIKRIFNWNCMSYDAEHALLFLYPFLITKKKEAKLALKFMRLGSYRKGQKKTPISVINKKEGFYLKLRNLKKYSY